MPDREKVIAQLTADMGIAELTGESLVHTTRETVETALALLREQEAVKPKAEDEAIRVVYNCGGCGYLVGFVSTIHDDMKYLAKFCPECGRRVKWDAGN